MPQGWLPIGDSRSPCTSPMRPIFFHASAESNIAGIACTDDLRRSTVIADSRALSCCTLRFFQANDMTPAPVPITTAPIHHGTPAFRRTNLALFAAGFATFGLLYCVQPLMPEFSNDYGVSAAVSALSLSLTTGVLAFAMLFAGILSDAWGRKRVMVVSLLSSALLVLLSAVMPNWPTLLLVRTLLGLTLSGLPAVAMTYLSEEMDVESIGLGMGLYISGSAVGGMGGRLITGVLTDFLTGASASPWLA